MAIKLYTEEEIDKKLATLELYKQTVKDIRYIMAQYENYHVEAWITINKLVNNPKIK